MKKVRNLLLIATLLFTIVACNPDETTPPVTETGYSTGVLVSNEGPFTTGTGDITYYDDVTGRTEANIFEKINSRPAGNIVQSVKRHGDYTFIVVNNANKVEVVNSKTFKSVTAFTEVVQPRYYTPINAQKGYITSWNNVIYVVDVNTFTITKTITTGKNSDQIAIVGNVAWVINSGGYVYDNTISIVDVVTDEVIQTIETEYNPRGIEVDNDGNVWVLSGGNSQFNTETGEMVYLTSPRLTCFDPTTYTSVKTIQFESLYDYVTSLTISKDKTVLYLLNNGAVNSFSTSGSTLSDLKMLYKLPEVKESFYSIKVNPRTGDIYCSNPKDYNSNGEIVILDPTGTKKSSFKSGITPGGFDF